MRKIPVTLVGGRTYNLFVRTPFTHHQKEYGVVASVRKNDQNSVRFIFKQLMKMHLIEQGYDLWIIEENGAWKLYVSVMNWPGRASYIAGMLHGYRLAKREDSKKWKRTVQMEW